MRRVGIVLAAAVGVLIVAVLVAAVAIRQVDHDPDRWHVDPLTASASPENSFRVVPPDTSTGDGSADGVRIDAVARVYDRPVERLAVDFDRIARRAARVEVVAGSAEGGFVTYVQRSFVFGFPDYVSVRFIAIDDESSTIAVLSRSRFGSSDLGANQRRVEAWLADL